MAKQILFLCTGNYYRSRFAEALFNHLVPEAAIDFIAVSRGLMIDETGLNQGPVSKHTRHAAEARGIHVDLRMPISLTYGDLQKSHLIIAVKEAEHRPMLDARFPGWSQRAIFWQVHDLDGALPELALAEIETHVRKLIDGLKSMNV